MWEVVGIGLGAIIGFIVVFFVLLFRLSRGMRRASEEFLEALKEKNYVGAYSYLSDQIKRDLWFENFEEFLYMRYLTDVCDHQFGGDFSVAANGSNGNYKTHLILNNESLVPLTLELMKFNGKWKIHAIDIQVRIANSYLKDNVAPIESEKNGSNAT